MADIFINFAQLRNGGDIRARSEITQSLMLAHSTLYICTLDTHRCAHKPALHTLHTHTHNVCILFPLSLRTGAFGDAFAQSSKLI